MLIPLDRTRPLGDQIYVHLREAILRGDLMVGHRLPATRTLAGELGVARNTVVGAYHRLESEGYVEGRRGGGTHVSPALPAGALPRTRRRHNAPIAARPGPGLAKRGLRQVTHFQRFSPLAGVERASVRWDFAYNVNVSDAASRRVWYRILRRHAAAFEARPVPYVYRQRVGPLHRALVPYLRLTRGVHCRPEQIVLLNSVQQGFQLAARLLTDPGDRVVVEDPHYIGMRGAFRGAGCTLVPVPVDEDGLRTDALPDDPDAVRVVYASPSHHPMTGAVLSLPRRLKLLDWARKRGAWVMEYDHNCEYSYQGTPVESLQGLDEAGIVIYAGIFTRLFSPEPALAYLVVPEGLVEPFARALEIEGHDTSRLEMHVMAEFLASGEMESLLRRVTRRLRSKRRCLLDALHRIPTTLLRPAPAPGGLHVHVTLPRVAPGELERFVSDAAAAGLGLYPDTPFHLRRPRRAGLVVGFAGLSEDEIGQGVQALAGELERHRPRGT